MLREFSEDLDRDFYGVIVREDALGVIVRGLIHVEHELIGLIESNMHDPAALDKVGLDYHGRIHLAVALGMTPRLIPPLTALGSLRNNLAHRLAAEVGQSEANNLYQAFASDDKEIIQRTHERIRKGAKGRLHPKKFSSMEPLDRIRIIIISLRAAVRAGRIQSEEMQLQIKQRLGVNPAQ